MDPFRALTVLFNPLGIEILRLCNVTQHGDQGKIETNNSLIDTFHVQMRCFARLCSIVPKASSEDEKRY